MLTKLELFDLVRKMLCYFHPFEMPGQRSLQTVWINFDFWQNSTPRLVVASLYG